MLSERVVSALKALNADAPLTHLEVRLRQSNGTWRWFEVAGRVVARTPDRRALRLVGSLSDINDRKHAESLHLGQNRILSMVATGVDLPEILNEIASFIESQSDLSLCSILHLNSEGNALFHGASPNLPECYVTAIDGLTVSPASGSCGTSIFRGEPVIVTDIEVDPLWHGYRASALQHGLRACSSWPIVGKHGKRLGTIALYFSEPKAPSPRDLQLLDVCTNLAGIAIESRASEERIRYLAHYDGLTSLPNRFLFEEFLDIALHKAQRHGTKFAVFFIDLDKFKDINDTFGHAAGDEVLRETASRLRLCLRQTDKIARMGGDEFYILIEDLDNGRYAAEVAQKLLEAASLPILVADRECQISVSIGIGIYPDDGDDGQSLLRHADQAMYRVKNLGKHGFQFFSDHDQIFSRTLAIIGRDLPLHMDRFASAQRERPPVL
jgi:diguanylate cyclase (GGDEF)-like protein